MTDQATSAAEEATQAPELDRRPFDPRSNADAEALIAMHQGYLLEEFDRIGRLSPGLPVAGFLLTLFLLIGDRTAGFASVDLKRCSVELVYVLPEFRGSGIGTLTLLHLRESCPRPMELKAPLSPGGEALAARLGLGLAWSTPEELASDERCFEEICDWIKRTCQHKKTGDPRRPCKRCYRTALKRYSTALVSDYVVQARRLLASRKG